MKNMWGICLIGALLSGCAGNNENSAAPMIRIAQKARRSGNAEAAINFYNKALEMEHDNTEALLGLAEAYIDLKLLDAASECIKKAENIGDNVSRSSYLRGKICLLSGDSLCAEREFLKSTSVDSINALGAVYDSRGDHRKAQLLYKQVIAKDPNYIDAYNNIGLSLMLCDKYKEAIFYLENACALPGANAAYRSNLALAYGLHGNLERAKSIYAQDFDGDELEEKISYLEDIISAKQQ
ncbi:MAG: tetratricopeptide repeat protein [Holosporaceae bacterium]|jgi:Flp pilus assembly protein TadD|nr:tetratricopeptide repeat protein [Holosporaceae bacterium]